MEFIEFDTQKDAEATARFTQWRQQHRERPALVLVEVATGRFLLHVETCPEMTRSADADLTSRRKLVHAQWPEQWEYLSYAANGAKVVDCLTCKPRRELRGAFVAFRRRCIWLRRCFNARSCIPSHWRAACGPCAGRHPWSARLRQPVLSE